MQLDVLVKQASSEGFWGGLSSGVVTTLLATCLFGNICKSSTRKTTQYVMVKDGDSNDK